MASKEAIKVYSMEEISAHNSKESLWLLIDGSVYDVTKFMDEHPGGEEILLDQAGMDATEPFEDVGHSADARQLMKEYKIGELSQEDRQKVSKKTESTSSCSWVQILLPLGVLLIASAVTWRYYHYT